jgi:hypothetical protein
MSATSPSRRSPRRKSLGFVCGIGLAVVLAGGRPAHASCGDFNGDGSISATDALGVLRAAVGLVVCKQKACDVDGSGKISATDALSTLKAAVGQPVAMACPCIADEEFFFASVWSPILTDCVGCHNATGIAQVTDYVLRTSDTPGYLEDNFEILRSFTAITHGKDGAALLLSKPRGVSHAGGQRLGMTTESPLYANLVELLERFDDPTPSCPGAGADFYEGVSYLTSQALLRKAALIFAGRLPTATEVAVVADGSDASLRQAIRGLMAGEGFEAFLMESANDRLLTDKFRDSSSSALGQLGGEYEYPHLYDRIDAAGNDQARWQEWLLTNDAVAQEPLRLIVNVVTKERPYTEILTADYMMVNPWSGVPYQAGIAFPDANDFDDWREAQNHGYRLPGVPHAGLLSSPMFLARYPSTSTNRNRARARWAYYFFLGVDIEALAPRALDPAALADADNPTMNNVHCTVCHSVMDPVAGTFQDWGDNGHYRVNGRDSLPWTYKSSGLYRNGDLWYRDMRSPGFNNVVMPASGNDNASGWAASQIAADPRFARGAVDFWWLGVFGRKPPHRPTELSDPDYAARLRAYRAYEDVAVAIAAAFREGTAGTASHGAYNGKDLLVEMAMSPLFRAESASGVGSNRAVELGDVGLGKLLTPEQLDRKLTALTGQVWAKSWRPGVSELLTTYRLYYGGIDSDGVTRRTPELNPLMSTVVERMALETACEIVVRDFAKPKAQRSLFSKVETTDRPDDSTATSRIRSNVRHLYEVLLGESLPSGHAEIVRAHALFDEVWSDRIANRKGTNLRWGSGYCPVDFDATGYPDRDPDHTIRSWIALTVYLLSDYRFLYE